MKSLPENSQRRLASRMVLISLALIMIYVVLAAHEVLELDEQLRLERRRRVALERRLSQKDQQMDAALEKIHELSPEDADGDGLDDEPDPGEFPA